MNAAANGAYVAINGANYFFETARITAARKLETTPLLDGGAFRAAAAASTVTIYLKARIKHSEMNIYIGLIRNMLGGRRDISVGGAKFTNTVLLSGKISSEEGKPYASCELIITEADN